MALEKVKHPSVYGKARAKIVYDYCKRDASPISLRSHANFRLLTMNLGVTQTPPAQTAAYLRTLPAIRERCGRVHDLATKGKLDYFDYHPEKEADVSRFCIGIMKVGGIPFTAVILA